MNLFHSKTVPYKTCCKMNGKYHKVHKKYLFCNYKKKKNPKSLCTLHMNQSKIKVFISFVILFFTSYPSLHYNVYFPTYQSQFIYSTKFSTKPNINGFSFSKYPFVCCTKHTIDSALQP